MKKKLSKNKNLNKRQKRKSNKEETIFKNIEKTKATPIKQLNVSKSSGIPKYVADRMARRIFFTAGIPTLMGMSVFVVSYFIVTRNIAEIPPSSTIAISALFFLLGLAGLSFGILSASWDKEPGSFFGIENIPLNIQRAKSAFKPASQNFEEKK
tara:strand:+ start:609 stop:1070 length:462 start_codon:yes stop_codon:yes gene_type:complete